MTFHARAVSFSRMAMIAAAVLLACSVASVQAQSSSSAEYHLLADPDATASPEGSPASHDNNRPVPAYGYPKASGLVSHLAAEFGGGWTTPASQDQHDITYGYDVLAGGGYKFNRHFALLGEFQYDHNKIPARVLQQVGEPGGNISIYSLTAEPVLNIKTSGIWGAYIVGGGGYYHKTTTFTQPALITSYYCDYFYCYPYQYVGNQTVAQFTDNAGGMNIGGGFTFGKWEGGKFFSEARYTWIDTPGRATKIVPVTLGFRW